MNYLLKLSAYQNGKNKLLIVDISKVEIKPAAGIIAQYREWIVECNTSLLVCLNPDQYKELVTSFDLHDKFKRGIIER